MLPPGHWSWNLNSSYPITCACLRLLKCVLRDHNSNNCTHSGNVSCCTYMVNNDYDKFRSFSRLYMTISASNLHTFAGKSRQIFSFSLHRPGGSTQQLSFADTVCQCVVRQYFDLATVSPRFSAHLTVCSRSPLGVVFQLLQTNRTGCRIIRNTCVNEKEVCRHDSAMPSFTKTASNNI